MHPADAPRVIHFQIHPGLEQIVFTELRELFPSAQVEVTSRDAIRVTSAAVGEAVRARTVIAAFVERSFVFARPTGLLGHEALTMVADDALLAVNLGEAATSFRVTAAGMNTPVFKRWIAALGEATGLAHDPVTGDVVIRVLRHPLTGWRVLTRLTARPLSSRPWRVPGFQGALDASVAAAMVRAASPQQDELFLDPTCGSGTTLIEHLWMNPGTAAVGCDINSAALASATVNASSAGVDITLLQADAQRLPLRDESVGVVCANLPWGHQFGSADQNDRLYQGVLSASARVGTEDCRIVVLTHAIRQFEAALAKQSTWQTHQRHQVTLRGHHPILWVLHRR